MDQLIRNSKPLEQSPGSQNAGVLKCWFWPEAEDRALRGRNLSAVFRTLYRQVGKSLKGLAFLCTHLAGRERMRKIHLPNFPRLSIKPRQPQRKKLPLPSLHLLSTKPFNCLSIFSGQVQFLFALSSPARSSQVQLSPVKSNLLQPPTARSIHQSIQISNVDPSNFEP